MNTKNNLNAGKNIFMALGGGNEIGASCYFMDICGLKVLFDCGLRPKSDRLHYPSFSELYKNSLVDGLWEIDAMFLSHAHLDHTGALPKIIFESSQTPVYSTFETKETARLLFKDISICNIEKKSHEVDFNYKLFNSCMAEMAVNKIIEKSYKETIKLPNGSAVFFKAGHIPGAAMVYVQTPSLNILYTGDFSNFDQYTVDAADIPDDLNVDVLISESTYGYKKSNHDSEVVEQRIDMAKKIEKIVNNCGVALIPSFAVGRTQEVALALDDFMKKGAISSFEVHVGGMAKKACELYEKFGIKIFGKNIKPFAPGDEKKILKNGGAVIASSGMLMDRSLSANIAEKILPDKKNAIFFTGYLDEESPGAKLAEIKNGPLNSKFKVNDKFVTHNAQINSYKLSAHSPADGIIRLIEKINPKNVIFVHGFPDCGGEINIMNECSRKFKKIKFLQSSNGVPISID